MIRTIEGWIALDPWQHVLELARARASYGRLVSRTHIRDLTGGPSLPPVCTTRIYRTFTTPKSSQHIPTLINVD